MSNSKLVSYTRLSPNCTKPRQKKITGIVIHHMAGNLTIEQCGAVFAPTSRQASANYGVGTDGRIGQYVLEENRAWTTGNAVDHSCITVEVANSKVGEPWPVSDKALEATISLCVDICRRNGIKKLNYTGDKRGNLYMHKWFQATGCPGTYLGGKFGYIASEVTKRLANTEKISVDGVFGPDTIRLTQQVLKVAETGKIKNQYEQNKKYVPAAGSGWTWVVNPKSDPTIKAMQKLVGAKQDGIIGKETIKKLQNYLKVSSDGIMGVGTTKAWQKYLNSKVK